MAARAPSIAGSCRDGSIVRRREVNGVTECETAYYLLSRPLSPTRFAEVARAQWGIENRLHWVLVVTMNENQSRARMDHAPHNLALMRRWALNACKLEGSKGSMKGKLKRAGWDDSFLTRLLSCGPQNQMR